MTEELEITPVCGPVSGTIRPPGSKSITNRALVLAALCDGESSLRGVLSSDDTQVMIESLTRLGVQIEHDTTARICTVQGRTPDAFAAEADLWLQNSGTSIRFLTALCSLGSGRYRLDGNARMRERPIGDLLDALADLGACAKSEGNNRCPPILVDGSRHRLVGGTASIRASMSSQYLSAVLMAAAAAKEPTVLQLDGSLVSVPYVTMTLQMMRAFGVDVEVNDDMTRFVIRPQPYHQRAYDIEPDASAASYFFSVAAVTGGRVTVQGLSRDSLQGDTHFVDALEQMGCRVEWASDSITVEGGALTGIDIDMNAISDTAQTLACVAVYADGPTTIRNVGHMRHKETDRIAAVVTELRRAGIAAEESTDGLSVRPGQPRPATIATYDDHRMAMSFSLLGLKSEGIRIADPGCTAKTYPDYFDDLRRLCAGSAG